MRCPTLAELPPPPPGKTGWPWTEESEQLPDEMLVRSEAAEPDDRPRTADDTSSSIVHRPSSRTWPRVSIVTPSYNQAQFIEETIRSVLLQGYPDLEYIIMDGGSTDGSVDIIRKYEPWLAYWVSEEDSGQSEAIRHGFVRSSGDIVAWLNSDDVYLPEAVSHAVLAMAHQPEAALLYGLCEFVDEEGQHEGLWGGARTAKDLIVKGNAIPQPSTFISHQCLEKVGGVDPNLHYVMDYELWIRLSRVGRLYHIPNVLSRFRHHSGSKTVSQSVNAWREWEKVLSARTHIAHMVSKSDLAEAKRRTQIQIALRSFLLGDEPLALEYLERSLDQRVWPYGSVDELARFLFSFRLNSETSMTEPRLWQLLRLIDDLRVVKRGRRLRAQLVSLIHINKAFNMRNRRKYKDLRYHLGIALKQNPRWLQNMGVLSMTADALLGPEAATQFRRMIRYCLR